MENWSTGVLEYWSVGPVPPAPRPSLPWLRPSLLIGAAVFLALSIGSQSLAQIPVLVETNLTVRLMAANLTSGNNQSYEAPGIHIFQGLKPDVVSIQEFKYNNSTSDAQLRQLVDVAFGTNFSYFRESGYAIPNGIISRWPILSSGSWEDVDTGVNDRGFAWAKVDLPGSNDLYVVSVHLKASNGTTEPARRYAESTNLVNLVRTSFPQDALIMIGGDCNLYDPSELAYQHLTNNFSDSPVPTDSQTGGNPNTNAGRSERYDYVFLSRNLATRVVPTQLGSRAFSKGLVFDSAVYEPLTEVAPVSIGDSHVSGMQHMAVVRDVRITWTATNFVGAPAIISASPGADGNLDLRVNGSVGFKYVLEVTTNLVHWMPLRTEPAPYSVLETNISSVGNRFYRARSVP